MLTVPNPSLKLPEWTSLGALVAAAVYIPPLTEVQYAVLPVSKPPFAGTPLATPTFPGNAVKVMSSR